MCIYVIYLFFSINFNANKSKHFRWLSHCIQSIYILFVRRMLDGHTTTCTYFHIRYRIHVSRIQEQLTFNKFRWMPNVVRWCPSLFSRFMHLRIAYSHYFGFQVETPVNSTCPLIQKKKWCRTKTKIIIRVTVDGLKCAYYRFYLYNLQ